MPYPAKPKQPDVNEEYRSLVPAAGVARVAALPQAIGGAPKLVVDPAVGQIVAQPYGQPVVVPAAPTAKLDYNRPPAPVYTNAPGPEMWDKPRRDVYAGQNGVQVPTVAPHPYLATDIIAEHPQLVDSLRTKLISRRKDTSDREIVKSPFWKQFDQNGSGFVAQLLGDIMGMLQQAQLREGTSELQPPQQDWVRSHPLTQWLNWQ